MQLRSAIHTRAQKRRSWRAGLARLVATWSSSARPPPPNRSPRPTTSSRTERTPARASRPPRPMAGSAVPATQSSGADTSTASAPSKTRSAMFAIIDHASGEAWVDASLRMDRWAVADLLREVCSERFGSLEAAVAAGLPCRARHLHRCIAPRTARLVQLVTGSTADPNLAGPHPRFACVLSAVGTQAVTLNRQSAPYSPLVFRRAAPAGASMSGAPC